MPGQLEPGQVDTAGLSLIPALIPDGPLHPGDAIWAIGAGLLVAGAARRHATRWVISVISSVIVVTTWRYGSILWDGLDHPDSGFVLLAAAFALLVGCARPMPVRLVAVGLVAASTAVWAVVPDTELPLIVGSAVAAALVGAPSRTRSRWAGSLVVLPLWAAVVGSLGRPSRLPLALGAAGTAMVAVVSVALVVRAATKRNQRAGTPITVEPAGTSSTTTAPAPTTAR